MKRSLLGLTFVLVASAMLAAPAAAQTSASDNIQVTGTVAGPISVAAGNDLAFGVIIPGLARTILPSDPGAGTFTVSGQSGAGVQLTFPGLPTVLSNGTPADDIPLTLSLVYNTSNSLVGGTTINPAVVIDPTTTLSADPTGVLYVFLGGTVTPAGAQTPGDYSNTFTLTAAYVNN
jgi:hypothetical protein